MKSLTRALLGVLTLGFISFFITLPAHADVTVKLADHNNGVNCYQHNGGSFPEDGHFFDCTTGASKISGQHPPQVQRAINALRTLAPRYPLVLKTFQDNNAQFTVLNNPLDYYALSTIGSCCTTAQQQTGYALYKGKNAFTNPPPKENTVIFANIETGTFPKMAAPTPSQTFNTVSHEAGHAYDFLINGSNYPSASAGAAQAAAWDQTLMQSPATPPNGKGDPDYSNHINAFKYWLQINQGGAQPVAWAEQFAEQTARANFGDTLPVDDVMRQWWPCSQLFTTTWLSLGRQPSPAEYAAIGCGNTPKKSATAESLITLQPLYTLIFADIYVDGVPVPTANIDNTTMHETGHWIDYLYAQIVGGAGSTAASGTSAYGQLISFDWQNFNTVQACNAMGLGTFNSYTDSAGNYFCNGANGNGSALQGQYVGLTNEQILTTAGPAIFGDNGDIFAEEFANQVGATDIGIASSLDQNFNAPNFAATQLEVHALIVTGQVPTAAQLQGVGYGTVPYTPKGPCQTLNSSPGPTWPETGHMFACGPLGRNDENAVLVDQAADHVGPYLQNLYNNLGVDIFVFQSISDYNAYADLAGGVPTAELDSQITGFVVKAGSTNHPSPYIVILEQPTNYGMPRVTNFELGRMFDAALGITSSGYFTSYINTDFVDINAASPNTGQLPAACTSQTTNENRFLCSMEPTEAPGSIDYASLVAEEYATSLPGGAPYDYAEGTILNYFGFGGVLGTTKTRSYDFIRSKAAGGAN